MNKPLLSVVVPVKLNTGTLEYTLKTILAQDYSNIQVVVSNGSNQSYVVDLINKINDKRIKCITPKETAFNFSADWEFALSGVDGEYVTFIGDDDGALSKGYALGMKYIVEHNVEAFTWKKINYNWPDHLLDESQNLLNGESKPTIQLVNSPKALKLLSKFRIGYNFLPCVYNSIVSMSAIGLVKKNSKKGTFFSGSIPDVYSGIALASVIKTYYASSFPLTVNGASVKSSGVIQGEKNLTKDQKLQIVDVLSSKERYHKHIGDFSTSITSLVMGEYILAGENIANFSGPRESWFWYIRHLTHEAKTSKHGDTIMSSARYTAKKRWFFTPFYLRSNKPKLGDSKRLYFFNGCLRLPSGKINNIEDATILLTDLVPHIDSITYVTWKVIIRHWIEDSKKTIIALYRISKL